MLNLSSTATDSSLSVALSGTGVSGGYLTPSPASLNFGSIPVGSSQTQSVTVTNSGGSSVGITQAAVSGSGFTMSGFSPQTLAVGQSLTLSVGFTATSAGAANGILNLSPTGYNVYRGTTSGGPYAKINPSVDTVTTYADSTVQSAQTYYYVTTSVASGGMESKYSNETSAQIP
jgi:Abnormal spindle-like microcephaly-assoc'd, ASPM-SPD-2-Hydin